MKKIGTFILTLLYAVTGYAQGIAINDSGADPDTSAILDVKSTAKGLLIPRMTQAQRDAIYNPASSLLIYQTNEDSGFYYRRGSVWYPFADNLGLHKMAQHLNTNGFTISRDGTTNGIRPFIGGEIRFYGIRQTTTTSYETARLDPDGGFVVKGELGYGIMPASGDGSRMMWYPYKSSFRAGRVDNGTGSWDEANTGFFSAAFGYNCVAGGNSSFSVGETNTVTGTGSMALGARSTVSGNYSSSLGYSNAVSDNFSAAIGFGDTTSGQGAIAIGYRISARGDYSVAIGQRATTGTYTGAFIATDGSTLTNTLSSSANNQFTTRYAGGYRLYTNSLATIGVQIAAGGSSWTTISDSTKKMKFATADGEAFLQRLRAMRIGSWNYKDLPEPEFRHYGPMAQDFYAAFGKDDYGTIGNDTTIASADMDGVLMIMVKALEKRTADQDLEISRLRSENEQLKQQVASSAQTSEEWEAFKTLMAGNAATRVLMEKVTKLANQQKQAIAAGNNH